MLSNDNLVLALPKGRILEEIMPLIARAGIEPEAAFSDASSRKLRFSTNHANLDIVRVSCIHASAIHVHLRILQNTTSCG